MASSLMACRPTSRPLTFNHTRSPAVFCVLPASVGWGSSSTAQRQGSAPRAAAAAATKTTAAWQCAGNQQRLQAIVCGSSSGDSPTVQTEALRVELPTAGARRSLRFDVAPMGTGQAIICVAVEQGSDAEEAGVQPGMRLTAISDPIRRDDVWKLQDRPSLKNIRELLKMRSADTITLEFEPWTGAMPSALTDGGLLPTSPASASVPSSVASSMSSTDSTESIGDRLERQYREAVKAGRTPTAVEQRQRRRREAIEQSDARDDRPLLLGLMMAFVLPPLVILLVAQSSGYLDSLYLKTLTGGR